jgi:hypothetical protein
VVLASQTHREDRMTPRPWTEGEDNILRRFHALHSDKQIARAMTEGGLARSPLAISRRRLALRLYRFGACVQASRWRAAA